MSKIKWVKITTDMFDNRKIKYLRSLPNGDSLVLLWIMLLTIAGRCNAGGLIFLTENIPCNANMLSDELGFDVNTVILGLTKLEELNMIILNEEKFMIANWCEYQNVDGMDKVREQTRKRVEKFRQKQKEIAEKSTCNDECNATVTQSSYSISNSISISDDKNVDSVIDDSEKEQKIDLEEKFNAFWKAYPKHTNTSKKNAKEKLEKALRKTDIDTILNAIERQKKTRQWIEGYIPMATTWLNGEHWDDEIEDSNHGGKNDKGTNTPNGGESKGEQKRDFSGFNFYDVY